MTREGLLAALRVNDFCRIVVHNRCLVWLNNVLWPHQLNEEKQLRIGDYVRIAVPAPNGQSLDAARRFLHITEEQARDHIVFEPSEEQSESADFEEQEESGSTHYGAPSSASEPEPHASVSLVEVHKFHALVLQFCWQGANRLRPTLLMWALHLDSTSTPTTPTSC